MIIPRTLRIDLESYDWILHYFNQSPDGITGAAAIRKLLRAFGQYCHAQTLEGRVPTTQDLADIPLFVTNTLNPDRAAKPTGPTTPKEPNLQ